jgi:hypothetical protein
VDGAGTDVPVPDPDFPGIDGQRIAFIAQAQRLFGQLAFSDVPPDGLQFQGVTVVVENHAIHPLLPADFPMSADDRVLVTLDTRTFAE